MAKRSRKPGPEPDEELDPRLQPAVEAFAALLVADVLKHPELPDCDLQDAVDWSDAPPKP